MSVLNLLNPTSWIGKIGIWAALFCGGMYLGASLVEPCPPTTSIEVKQNIKGKKGAVISSNLATSVNGQTDCNEWLRGLKMKEIRNLRK